MSRTIVIIDDTTHVTEMLTAWLEMSNYTVVAITGPIREEHLALASVDAVLLDIMLNGSESGIEIARALRAHGYDRPLIGMSASDGMVAAAEASGVFDVVVAKPFDNLLKLTVMLEKLIEAHHGE